MTKHLFCLEGEYENSLRDRTSVLPLLEYLETALGLEYIYRRTATPEEFFFFLEKSCRKNYQDYRLLYLAFHGEANYIYTSAQQWVSLEEIAEVVAGRWKGKAVHFSSCDTLNVEAEALSTFKNTTGATLVSGYREGVDFRDGALIDMALAAVSAEYEMLSYVPARLQKDYPDLIARTGLLFA